MNPADVTQVFRRVTDKYRKQIRDVDERRNNIQEKLAEFNERFNKYYQRNCKEILAYFEANSINQDDKLILKNEIDNLTKEKKYKELDECYNKFAKPVDEFYNQCGETFNQSLNNLKSCENRCSNLLEDDAELCFTNCTKTVISQFNKIYDDIEVKLADFNNKIL
jgi:DNA repair ATPase RecN